MSIWFSTGVSVSDLNAGRLGTLAESLGIEFVSLDENSLSAKMPVDSRTMQPFGLLHGGASLALAETLGSVGAQLVVDPVKFRCVGLDINANHVRSVSDGEVLGIASPLHLGFSTQVWEIRVVDNQKRLVAISRLTMAVLSTRA